MKLHRVLTAVAASSLLITGCLLEDEAGGDGEQFTCDATATFAEMCMQEPSSFATQSAAKSTCNSAKGLWIESGGSCPGAYKKKCVDGDKTVYFYNASDASKNCSELVAAPLPLSGERFASAFEFGMSIETAAGPVCAET